MRIFFEEQDVIDSVCVWMVNYGFATGPDFVDVRLFYEDDGGLFWAEGFGNRGSKELDRQDIVDGIAMYLEDWHNFDTSRITIDLCFTGTVTAEILTNV